MRLSVVFNLFVVLHTMSDTYKLSCTGSRACVALTLNTFFFVHRGYIVAPSVLIPYPVARYQGTINSYYYGGP